MAIIMLILKKKQILYIIFRNITFQFFAYYKVNCVQLTSSIISM